MSTKERAVAAANKVGMQRYLLVDTDGEILEEENALPKIVSQADSWVREDDSEDDSVVCVYELKYVVTKTFSVKTLTVEPDRK